MEQNPNPLDLEIRSSPGRWQTLGALVAVGVTVTVVIFVTLGRFAAPDERPLPDADQQAVLDQPFATGTPGLDEGMPGEAPQACEVMHTALQDINKRMSEGVTPEQARYFRARRNKLYLMMRERCGV